MSSIRAALSKVVKEYRERTLKFNSRTRGRVEALRLNKKQFNQLADKSSLISAIKIAEDLGKQDGFQWSPNQSVIFMFGDRNNGKSLLSIFSSKLGAEATSAINTLPTSTVGSKRSSDSSMTFLRDINTTLSYNSRVSRATDVQGSLDVSIREAGKDNIFKYSSELARRRALKLSSLGMFKKLVSPGILSALQANVLKPTKVSKKKASTKLRFRNKETVRNIRTIEPEYSEGAVNVNLIAIINKELPNVIKNNMGSPGLNYRTGRFANSVKVESLSTSREGTISAFYSYMMNPYQTFEPGFAQGSVSRDPKALISRSIRQIAQEHVSNKFRSVRL